MSSRFKRFTFSLWIDGESKKKLESVFSGDKWESVKKKFKQNGGRSLEVYSLENEVFIILDTNLDYVYTRDLKKMANSNEYQEWLEHVAPFGLGIVGGDSSDQQAMERIYKMEQQNEFKPSDGIIKEEKVNDYKRYCLTLSLVDDPEMIKEYKRVHSKEMFWPQITQNMKDIGVLDMEIYLRDAQAFMVMDTKPGFDYEKDSEEWGNMPGEKQWQDYVSKFQRTARDSSIKDKWQPMQKI